MQLEELTETPFPSDLLGCTKLIINSKQYLKLCQLTEIGLFWNAGISSSLSTKSDMMDICCLIVHFIEELVNYDIYGLWDVLYMMCNTIFWLHWESRQASACSETQRAAMTEMSDWNVKHTPNRIVCVLEALKWLMNGDELWTPNKWITRV